MTEYESLMNLEQACRIMAAHYYNDVNVLVFWLNGAAGFEERALNLTLNDVWGY